jgi:hypothetical protein
MWGGLWNIFMSGVVGYDATLQLAPGDVILEINCR